MNFYRRRPLALALSLCIAMSAAASFVPVMVLRVCLLVFCVVAGIGAFLFFRKFRPGALISGVRAPAFALLTGIGCTLMVLSAVILWDRIYFYDDFVMDEGDYPDEITAVVTDIRRETGYGATYTVRLKSLNGGAKRTSGLMFNDTPLGLQRGDVISGQVRFSPLGEVFAIYGMEEGEMAASGWLFACEAGRVEITGETHGFSVFMSELRGRLNAALSLYLDRDSAGLAGALLLGVRNEPAVMRRDFSRIGASHLLALSGLHLTIICGILGAVLLKLRIPRRARIVITSVFIVLFLILTGCPYSALRAGIMCVIAETAFLFRRGKDRITALFIAGAGILLFDPAAIYDIGFMMSFTSTLGVVLFTADASRFCSRRLGGHYRKHPFLKKVSLVITGVFAAVGAVIFLIPLQMAYFGEVSLMTVPSSLLLTPICEVLIWLLIPQLIFSAAGFRLLAGRLGLIISLITKLIGNISSFMSRARSLVSLEYPFALPIILIFAVVVIVMMVKNVKSWLYVLIPFCAASLVYLGGVGIYGVVTLDDVPVSWLGTPTNDVFVMTVSGQGYVVDITNGNTTLMYTTCDELRNMRQTEVKACGLTHLHRRHAYSLARLCARRMVRTIILPEPLDEEETGYAEDIRAVADEYGAEVMFFPRPSDAEIEISGVRLTLYGTSYIKRSVHPLIGLRFDIGDAELLYEGAALWESPDSGGIKSDIVIFGSHGPKIKSLPDGFSGKAFTLSPELSEMNGVMMPAGTLRMNFRRQSG